MTHELSDEQLSRYSRHILLPEIDLAGQAKLTNSHAVIIGAGGLGSPAAMYLASSGVGKITIFDHDEIDLGNLQRQIGYRTQDIGQSKATSLSKTLKELNPEIEITPYPEKFNVQNIEQVPACDVIIDACDNFDTRFAINRISLETNTPLVSGAAIQHQGQLSVFDPTKPDSPCYHCLYGEDQHEPQQTCRDLGVFAPLVGIIGSAQAAEALKILLKIGNPLVGRLFTIDALTMIPRVISLPKDPLCLACGQTKNT